MIRNAILSDIDSLVELHRSTLPNDLFPRMGTSFLRKIFYPTAINDADVLILVVEKKNKILSVIVLALKGGAALTQEIGKKRLKMAATLPKIFFKDPRLLIEMISGYRNANKKKLPAGDISNSPEIYLIATANDSQGKGFGKRLIERGIEIIKTDTSITCDRILVKTDSESAKRFYEKNGFVETGLELRAERRLHLLAKRLYD